MLNTIYNAPIAPVRRVLSSEDFIETFVFLEKGDPQNPTQLHRCVLDASIRPYGSSEPGQIWVTSDPDSTDYGRIIIDDPKKGLVSLIVWREIIRAFGISGDYEFELRAERSGVRVSQMTAIRRFAPGVLADQGTLDGTPFVIDRAGNFGRNWRFIERRRGQREPLRLTRIALRATLSPVAGGPAVAVWSTENGLIKIVDTKNGLAELDLPHAVTEALAPGIYTLLVQAIRGADVTVMGRPSVTVI